METTTDNPHLRHIKEELEKIEDEVDDIPSVPYSVQQRIMNLRSYVNQLSLVEPKPAGLVRLCTDCGQEEANPGLDCCGQCYHKRIWGN